MDYAVDPDNPCTLLHLGMALVTTRHMREARQHLMRLIGMRMEGWECTKRVYDLLAEVALFEGNPAEAAEFAQCGLRLFPDDENLLLALATAYYSVEDYKQTASVLERIIQSEKKPRMYFGAEGNIRGKMAPRMLGAVRRMLGRTLSIAAWNGRRDGAGDIADDCRPARGQPHDGLECVLAP
jgi:tetratricopeptide (TPR) repeat protein